MDAYLSRSWPHLTNHVQSLADDRELDFFEGSGLPRADNFPIRLNLERMF
jgi:hypothetical protein